MLFIKLIALGLVFVTSSAMAAQTIKCQSEVMSGSLEVKLYFNRAGQLQPIEPKIKLRGYYQNGSPFGQKFQSISIVSDGSGYTQIDFVDQYDSPNDDYPRQRLQLQFATNILNRDFSQTAALLVSGEDRGSTEKLENYALHMNCSGRK
ncbi:MAG: hypothetical protein COT74_05590 [Bdellovibrionales bacterium CG10_big_fil_rev_8_21_14_0_10_45_34]|nr:MAG: hypothetical protein COT74_05590 [Bdellovibrionales bacterium CG10_big_fil_rev_8_21_14_0_10_45_34]